MQDDAYEISRLCYILEQRRIAELALNRANYRVSYYRKIRARLNTKSPKGEILEITKKIEAARLAALKKNEALVNLKEKTKKSVNSILKKISGRLVFANGKVIGIHVIVDYKSSYMIQDKLFADKAANYEATIALNRVLSSK
jgi:hypothetical protein